MFYLSRTNSFHEYTHPCHGTLGKPVCLNRWEYIGLIWLAIWPVGIWRCLSVFIFFCFFFCRHSTDELRQCIASKSASMGLTGTHRTGCLWARGICQWAISSGYTFCLLSNLILCLFRFRFGFWLANAFNCWHSGLSFWQRCADFLYRITTARYMKDKCFERPVVSPHRALCKQSAKQAQDKIF